MMFSDEAYWHAKENHTKPGFNLKHYQKIACSEPIFAYYFAKYIPGSDILYCQEHACKSVYHAYCFAEDIPGADIAYCRKACESDEYWLNEFYKMIIEKAMQ